MLIGIGFVGMLTGTIATYFLRKSTKSTDGNPSQVLDLTDLDPEKYVLIKEYSEYIRSKD